MGVIIFNGIPSTDYHIQVEHPPGYETPAKDYDITHVPGRNGDVYIDKGSYKNVSRSYEIAVGSDKMDFTRLANGLSEWLHSASGYARLEDSYEPDYYRLAVYEEGVAIENILRCAGRVTVSFNCKPQRFLKLGDEPVKFTRKGYLYNPTGFMSLPIINVSGHGAGILGVGKYKVSIALISNSITIDSETQDAYSGTMNRNPHISLVSGNFPKLEPGNNEISFSGGITSVEVIPKWWTL